VVKGTVSIAPVCGFTLCAVLGEIASPTACKTLEKKSGTFWGGAACGAVGAVRCDITGKFDASATGTAAAI
jgi:hypothetical protein